MTARPAAFVLAAAGVALAACALATVSAASLVVKDRAVGRAISALPPDQRAVRVTWVGVSTIPADSFASLDRQVRAVTRPLGTNPPTAVLLYRDTRFGKQILRLGAVDGLGRAVALTSGRLARPCVPGRCEVVAIGKSGFGAPGFTVTGHGSLRSDPVGSFFQSVAPGGRLRLAGGVDGLTRLPALRDSFRTYGWVAPLGSHDVRGWDVDSFRARIGRASTALEASSPNFSLTAPTVALADAGAKSRIAGRRLLLVGGQAVVLLLAFVLLAATRLRRGARASARRLDSFGATGWQARLAALAEAALVVVPATLLGWLLGAIAALALAEATDTPPGAVVSRSVASVTAIELMLGVAVLGTLVLYLGSRARAVAIGGLTISIADVAAAGALVAVLVAFAVGGADAQSLASSEGTGIVLMLLPGLIALVVAVVIARVLQPVLRACERAAAGRSLSLKLALLSLARAPGTATVAIVFVSVSVGLAVFAAAYRSTLIRNDSDRAAFEVPLDYTVKQDPRFVSDATPVGAAYAAAFNAVPVVRLQGEAPSLDRRAVTDARHPRGRPHAAPLAQRLRVREPESARRSARGPAGHAPGHADPGGRARVSASRHDPRRLDPPLRQRPHAERPVHRPRPRRAEQHGQAGRRPRTDPARRPRRPARRARGRVLASRGVHRRAPRDRQGADVRGLPRGGAAAAAARGDRGWTHTDAPGRLPRLGRCPGGRGRLPRPPARSRSATS